jgi:hypothetical protein
MNKYSFLWIQVGVLILCIVPSRISKYFARLKMAFCYKLNRPVAVTYFGPPTLHSPLRLNERILFFINFKTIGLINPQVNT